MTTHFHDERIGRNLTPTGSKCLGARRGVGADIGGHEGPDLATAGEPVIGFDLLAAHLSQQGPAAYMRLLFCEDQAMKSSKTRLRDMLGRWLPCLADPRMRIQRLIEALRDRGTN